MKTKLAIYCEKFGALIFLLTLLCYYLKFKIRNKKKELKIEIQILAVLNQTIRLVDAQNHYD